MNEGEADDDEILREAHARLAAIKAEVDAQVAGGMELTVPCPGCASPVGIAPNITSLSCAQCDTVWQFDSCSVCSKGTLVDDGWQVWACGECKTENRSSWKLAQPVSFRDEVQHPGPMPLITTRKKRTAFQAMGTLTGRTFEEITAVVGPPSVDLVDHQGGLRYSTWMAGWARAWSITLVFDQEGICGGVRGENEVSFLS